MEHRAGFVNILGNPNVGKSTLMNRLVGEKLSIITSKSQTTRHRIKGIVNGEDFQIVFSDTPGVVKPSYKMQEYMLERSEKKSCEDASDDRVIRNIRNVIREKEELKEQRKSGSFMYGVSAFLVVVIIVIGINLMNNYEKMRRLNQSVDNLMNQLEGNERGGQDGDDNGVHDSEASGDISVDGNAIKVNRLSGDVYPLEENSTSDKTERETVSDNNAASETTQAISESETDASVSSVKTDSYSMYTVKQGDTLMGICKRYYGTTTKYQEVMQYNGLDDSDMLYIGQQIKLPE